jgi:hypothetical protein
MPLIPIILIGGIVLILWALYFIIHLLLQLINKK